MKQYQFGLLTTKRLLFLLTLFLLSSCNSETEQLNKETEKWLKEEEQKQIINNKVISEISCLYNTKLVLDSIKLNYSIDLQKIANSGYEIIRKYSVSDIFEENSIKKVLIRVKSHTFNFMILLKITDEQEKVFRKKEMKNVLVVDIKKIKPLYFKFDIDAEISGDEIQDAVLVPIDEQIVLCKADLITIREIK